MYKYIYNDKLYLRKVTIISIVCMIVGIFSLVKLIQGKLNLWIICLICFYQVYNTFFSISNPKTIEIKDETMSFSAYGKTHTYMLDEIDFFRVKEINYYKKMYVRINDYKLGRGRYWINCEYMNNGNELWDELSYFEYIKNPNQLKYKARVPSDSRIIKNVYGGNNG